MTANFEPDRFEITAATNAAEAVITTASAHGYSVGWFVRVWVPKFYGMRVIPTRAKVLSIPATNQLKLDLDTRQTIAFATPATKYQVAQVVPISGTTRNIAT